ncbi:hypothetical protein SAMN05660236_0285 [Ohtaekwangia koreensis]|uniref:Uncharacterized protein n=1 Tax=Ohtaekwangia koreensis TaxID=688867 RepID=A0A1T5IQL6_9BACT|nr:hypothetical protein SAMN05660236_0285 [Ohtaekwangia koreensis]
MKSLMPRINRHMTIQRSRKEWYTSYHRPACMYIAKSLIDNVFTGIFSIIFTVIFSPFYNQFLST